MLPFSMFRSRQLSSNPDLLVFSIPVPSFPDLGALRVSAFSYLLFRLSPGRRSPLSPVESALPQNAPLTRLESALPKTQHLRPFRIRTYRKRGRGSGPLLTTHCSLVLVHCTPPPPSNLRGAKPHA